jgi:branched-chain amino acid transport system permease protein
MSSSAFSTSYRREFRLVRTNAMRVWAVLLVAVALYLPWVVQDKSLFGLELSKHMLLNINMTTVNIALVAMVGALGLNILTGYTGLISIGNAGFFALGAIVAAFLGGTREAWPSLPFPLVVLAAGVVGAIVGAIIGLPSYRIRGIYLLLATLSFHFIMVWLFLKFQVTWYGFGGIQFATPADFLGIDLDLTTSSRVPEDVRWYYFFLGCVVVSFLCAKNLFRTRQGRAFVAVRDQPIAAAMAGIDVPRIRVTSFALSSFLVTAIGAAYAWYLGAASPDTFTLLFAIQFIAMIVIGGEGSLLGTALGALLWSLIPTALIAFSEMAGGVAPSIDETVLKWQTQITNIIFGVLIVLVMIFNPTGLAGIWARVKRSIVRWPYTT